MSKYMFTRKLLLSFWAYFHSLDNVRKCKAAPRTALRHKNMFNPERSKWCLQTLYVGKSPWTSHRPDWETGLGQRVKGLGIQSSSENTAKTAHTDRYWTEVSKADTPVGESDKYSMLGLLLIKGQIILIVFCSFELMWSCCFNDFTFQNTDHLVK